MLWKKIETTWCRFFSSNSKINTSYLSFFQYRSSPSWRNWGSCICLGNPFLGTDLPRSSGAARWAVLISPRVDLSPFLWGWCSSLSEIFFFFGAFQIQGLKIEFLRWETFPTLHIYLKFGWSTKCQVEAPNARLKHQMPFTLGKSTKYCSH